MIEVAQNVAFEAGWKMRYSLVVKKQAWSFEQGLSTALAQGKPNSACAHISIGC